MNHFFKSLAIFCVFISTASYGDNFEAFGNPGATPNWTPASKTHLGVHLKANAKNALWFTSAEGILTEVYFPTIDNAQIKDSQFLISDGKSYFREEKKLPHQNNVLSPYDVSQTNGDTDQKFKITHRYFTANNSATLFDNVTIDANVDDLSFYLLTNPHLNNSGLDNVALVDEEGFSIYAKNTQLKIRTTIGLLNKSVGFVGASDGYQDISKNFKMTYHFLKATNGNTATTGQINIPPKKGHYEFTVIYTFNSLSQNNIFTSEEIKRYEQNYFQEWNNYLNSLQLPTFLSSDEKMHYLHSMYVLKCHEDHSKKGAIIASLTVPWGESQLEQTEQAKIGGYHLVWPRDLYNIALAFLYAGDKTTAKNALSFLRSIQFKNDSEFWNFGPRVFSKKGSFPQNVWINGNIYWEGYQADQTAFPLLLFAQIYQTLNPSEQNSFLNEYRSMILSALHFLKDNGPWTQEERWEENFGISPSTFSAVTAALVFYGQLFNDDFGNELKMTANAWLTRPNDNIDTWTYTTKGIYSNGEYYLRIAGGDTFDANWNPNKKVTTHIANSSVKIDQRLILDQGFLQLSLLGLKKLSDGKILQSKDLIDEKLSVMTPMGQGYYRYSFDAYGESGKGRLWPLLSGEHARVELEKSKEGLQSMAQGLSKINQSIKTIMKFSNDGLMIPEQVYESTGKGTGSATPLAWAHAELIKLFWSRELSKNIENILN